MRGLIAGAGSPVRIASAMPAMYEDDDFALRLTDAFDEVAAPLHTSLDSLAAYLDPWLAPEDYLAWLASWVGSSEELRYGSGREVVATAAHRHGVRGTGAGLLGELVRVTGLDPDDIEIIDSGGVVWSATPGTGVAATEPAVRIRIATTVRDPAAVKAAVAACVPVHVRVHLELDLEEDR